MKVLILLSICAFGYGERFEKAFAVKCNDNSGNKNAYTELQEAFRNYHICQAGFYTSIRFNPIEDHEGFCNYLRHSGFYKCVENLTIGAAPCLADTEKYFPDFLLNVINSTRNELCGVDGVNNSKLLYNKILENEKCSRRVQSLYWGELACLSELTAAKNLNDGIINLNKHDVCFDLVSFKTCMNELLERTCEDHYAEVLDLVFRPLTQECNDL